MQVSTHISSSAEPLANLHCIANGGYVTKEFLDLRNQRDEFNPKIFALLATAAAIATISPFIFGFAVASLAVFPLIGAVSYLMQKDSIHTRLHDERARVEAIYKQVTIFVSGIQNSNEKAPEVKSLMLRLPHYAPSILREVGCYDNLVAKKHII